MAADKIYNSSYSLEKTPTETSGSYSYWSDTPSVNLNIGDTFRPIEGSPLLNVNKIDISDEVIGEVNGKLQRQWQIRIEGSTEEQGDGSSTDVTYDFTISSDEKSGSMTVVTKGSTPSITMSVGNNFTVPGIGLVKCTGIKGSNSFDDKGIQTWTVIYEGTTSSGSSGGESGDDDDNPSIPENETSTTYELNGTTVRTVAGTLLVLQRSNTNAMRKTLTIYNNSETALATIGQTYQGGIALSESIMKETIKKNGVTVNTYYKHTIEVES